jgi:hypothetical protein
MRRLRQHFRFVPFSDLCSAARKQLFDHLVGAGEIATFSAFAAAT